jgi:hypothetical protein
MESSFQTSGPGATWLLEHIHKFKLGAGKSLRMLQRGLFPSHEINLWICSYYQSATSVEALRSGFKSQSFMPAPI